MAMLCRSAVMAGARSVLARSKTQLTKTVSSPKPTPSSPFSSSTRAIPRPSASRIVRMSSVLGTVESLMPLHSAIASARLKSSLAVNSACWSWLSEGLVIPS